MEGSTDADKKDHKNHMLTLLITVTFIISYSLLSITSTNQINKIMSLVIKGDGVNWEDIGIIMLFVLMAALSLYASKCFIGYFSSSVIYEVRKKVFSSVLNGKYYAVKMEEDALMTRALSDVNELEAFLSQSLYSAFYNIFLLSAVYVYLFILNWRLAVTAIFFYPLILSVLHFVSKQVNHLLVQRKAYTEEYLTAVKDSFDGIEIERSFALQDLIDKKVGDKVDEIYRIEVKERVWLSYVRAFSFALRLFPILFCCVVIIISGFLDRINAAEFVTFTILINMIASPINEIPSLFLSCKQIAIIINRINKLLMFPVEKADKELKRKTDIPILIQNMNFCYRTDEAVLKNISICINKGEHVAIVGGSGSGKSTLVKILLGL